MDRSEYKQSYNPELKPHNLKIVNRRFHLFLVGFFLLLMGMMVVVVVSAKVTDSGIEIGKKIVITFDSGVGLSKQDIKDIFKESANEFVNEKIKELGLEALNG